MINTLLGTQSPYQSARIQVLALFLILAQDWEMMEVAQGGWAPATQVEDPN